ncbi:MAG: S1 RNA-binding domain-containing protein [Paludibaculum sp.]
MAEFGAFVEIFPGTDGLLHISEISENRVSQRPRRAQRRRPDPRQGARPGRQQDQAQPQSRPSRTARKAQGHGRGSRGAR